MKMCKWSQERIDSGVKKITSRSKPSLHDPDVLFVFSKPIPLWIIKEYFYIEEGAKDPEELQRKVNQIWRRKVAGNRELYVHVLKPSGNETGGRDESQKEASLVTSHQNKAIVLGQISLKEKAEGEEMKKGEK